MTETTTFLLDSLRDQIRETEATLADAREMVNQSEGEAQDYATQLAHQKWRCGHLQEERDEAVRQRIAAQHHMAEANTRANHLAERHQSLLRDTARSCYSTETYMRAFDVSLKRNPGMACHVIQADIHPQSVSFAIADESLDVMCRDDVIKQACKSLGEEIAKYLITETVLSLDAGERHRRRAFRPRFGYARPHQL